MVELRTGPLCCRVATRTIRREPGGHVVRVGGLVEVFQVAARAIRWRIGKLIVHVALVAGHVYVRACQRELCRSVVIELCPRPRSGRVAHRTGSRKTGRAVIRIRGVVEILEVAASAVGRNGGIVPSHMALRAGHADVCAGQGKADQIMVKLGVLPARRSVTGVTLRGEVEALVIGIGRLRVIG